MKSHITSGHRIFHTVNSDKCKFEQAKYMLVSEKSDFKSNICILINYEFPKTMSGEKKNRVNVEKLSG